MASTHKGGVHSRAPKHMNTFAFKHNPNSKKTNKILATVHRGLCPRCHEQIEWRKKYRKYKPLKAAKKCRGCEKKAVTRAYHTLCPTCAGGRKVCAKCIKPLGAQAEENSGSSKAKLADVEDYLSGLKEREKRTLIRKIQRGEMVIQKTAQGITLTEVEPEEEDANGEEQMEVEEEDDAKQ